MDDSYGSFSRNVHYLGGLSGTSLVDSRLFFAADKRVNYKYGVGNRINLYVQNEIAYIANDPPQYGLYLEWYMWSGERQVPEMTPNNDANEFWYAGGGTGNNTSQRFTEMFLEDDDALLNPYVKTSKALYRVIILPNKKEDFSEGFLSWPVIRSHMVIPITAMADYLRIHFYSNPTNYVYGVDDSIRVWACPGHDAEGALHPAGLR